MEIKMKKYLFLSLIFIFTMNCFSQNSKRITGKVISEETSKPIPNAVVAIDHGIHFTYTNPVDGSFTLYLTEKSEYLLVYAPGYLTQSIKLSKSITNYIIKFSEISKVKDEVKITGKDSIGGLVVPTELSRGKSSFDKRTKSGLALESRVSKSSIATSGGSVENPLMPSYSTEDRSSSEMSAAPPPFDNNQKAASSGLLTAGEVNDFSKWIMWNDLSESDLSEHKDNWKFYPFNRYTVQLNNEFKAPVFGAKVNLLENGYVVWSSFTDNTGKAELWINPFTNIKSNEKNLSVEIEYQGKYEFIDSPKKFSEGINFFQIKSGCVKPKSADIVFLVDATGSMGDEINYLKLDLQDIMKKISDTIPNLKFNLGSVFYRDTLDNYLTKYSDFSQDVNVTSAFIADNNAGGGGDFPEAVHRGLDVAINRMSWNPESITKVIFMILDAPPHNNPEVIAELQQQILKASEKGIRIIPVACSGVDKSTEYILRSMALLTNGTYTFLTDDSGIGNPHIKPSTDKYEVETLKELLIRLVYQYSYYPECQTQYPLLVNDTLNIQLPETGNSTSDVDESAALSGFKYYPNPTFGQIKIEISGKAEELFISDISGKVIYRISPNGKTELEIDLSSYPSGMYYIMYQYSPDKWIKGKIILMH
jgi:hypothetical protein